MKGVILLNGALVLMICEIDSYDYEGMNAAAGTETVFSSLMFDYAFQPSK